MRGAHGAQSGFVTAAARRSARTSGARRAWSLTPAWHSPRPSAAEAMADRTAALRGGVPDEAQPGASGRTTTPAWLDQRESRPQASKARGTTVKRYWPGQAPSFGDDQHGDLPDQRPAGGGARGDPTAWSGYGQQALLSEAQPQREIRPPQVVALPRREVAPQHQAPAPPEEEEEEDEEEVLRRRAAARARCAPATVPATSSLRRTACLTRAPVRASCVSQGGGGRGGGCGCRRP
jgi:hypothetical protein